MKLRELKLKDAPLMLEWMHDDDIVGKLRTNFLEKNIEDCEQFITDSLNKKQSIHLAIVSNEDEYMGTISLKNIDRDNRYAELGISIRKIAMKKGYSKWAMEEILKKAFNELDIKTVYWCVLKDNIRAIKFYEKNGFNQTTNIPNVLYDYYGEIDNLKWYSIFKEEFERKVSN